MGDLTNNFSVYEFACPVSGESKMNFNTVVRLQELRDLLTKLTGKDYPLIIVEGGGYRTTGGTYSAHRGGMAVDIGFPRMDYYMVLKAAIQVGFTGIGCKQKGGKYQMHLDDAPSINGVRIRPVFWTY